MKTNTRNVKKAYYMTSTMYFHQSLVNKSYFWWWSIRLGIAKVWDTMKTQQYETLTTRALPSCQVQHCHLRRDEQKIGPRKKVIKTKKRNEMKVVAFRYHVHEVLGHLIQRICLNGERQDSRSSLIHTVSYQICAISSITAHP